MFSCWSSFDGKKVGSLFWPFSLDRFVVNLERKGEREREIKTNKERKTERERERERERGRESKREGEWVIKTKKER